MSNGRQVSEALLHERIRNLKAKTGDLEGKVDGLIDGLADLAAEVESIKATQGAYRTVLHVVGWILTAGGSFVYFLVAENIIL